MIHPHERRTFLKSIAAVSATGTATGTVLGQPTDQQSGARTTIEEDAVPGTVEQLDHLQPESSSGTFYSYGTISPDGEYAVVGGFGLNGSTMVDISDPAAIEELHALPNADQTSANDVKFDPDRALYYRSQELADNDGEIGFEVVDFGWGDGSSQNPEVVAQFETPNTGVHKLDVHWDEPIVYAVDKAQGAPGLLVVDVSDPTDPEHADEDDVLRGPAGYVHDLEPDPTRDLLYGAYILGQNVGIAVWDIKDPYDPELRSFVDYDERPDYEELNEPGFQACHQVNYDPERDLLIVGDELGGGFFGDIPGGKHVWDIGWGDGSPDDPEHIGFTHSPNVQQGMFGYTGHFHDIIPKSQSAEGRTVLVDGGYHEGVWTCDITDPTDPTPAQQSLTVDAVDEQTIGAYQPFCWGAEYHYDQDIVFATDQGTGLYTFEVSDEEFEFRTPTEQVAATFSPSDEVTLGGVRLAQHYWRQHPSVPNTGGQPMDLPALRNALSEYDP